MKETRNHFKESFRKRLIRNYGSRKVFIVFLVCCFIIFSSMLSSIILTFTAKNHTVEKMVEHIALCTLALVLSWVPVLMRARFNFHIPAFLQITATVFIVAHFVLGEVYRFYDYIFLFDKALHMTAGAVISILGFSVVYGFSKTKSGSVRLSPFFVALFSFCFALALLVIWEIFEYAMDSFFGLNMQRWQDVFIVDGQIQDAPYGQGSGIVDTMSDLIVGAVGAAAICFFGGLYVRKYPDTTKFFITKIRKPEAAPQTVQRETETQTTDIKGL